MCVELTVEQVAVKSLLVYTSDEVTEATEKKTKVSTSSTKVTFIRYTELTVCRGYIVSSKYVQGLSIKILCLCMVTHLVLARSWR